MAVAAETLYTQSPESTWCALSTELPEVLVVPDMLTDQQTRQRAARFIGVAILGAREAAEFSTVQSPIESLHEAIQLASCGDKVAQALVETNVRTDVIERTIKTGHVMSPVPLVITEEGKIVQHGQSMDSVQANSLRYAADHPIMRARTEAETRNAFRIEELNRAGFFEDYCFVVLSRAENLPEAGFFTDTMSCSLQVTAKKDNGLATESAFVSGIASAGGEQHDETTIVKLGAKMGKDLAGMTPAEIIDMPLLVRKDLMPNGAIDIVKQYDDCAGGMFFGEATEREDYMQYLLKCQKREQTFMPKVAMIRDELVGNAKNISSPVEAVEKLHELSEKHMVEKAITDRTIDPLVFGPIAAPHIAHARLAADRGDWADRDNYLQKAKDTASSSSCPGKLKKLNGLDADDELETDASDEDCEYVSKECPVCHKKNVKTTRTKTSISGDCGCSVKR